MKKYFIFLFLLFFSNKVSASIKENIIKNLENTQSLSFNFEQNINGKIENGNCKLEYPKKIFCKYNLNNNKKLVSNGRSLVIKTTNSYYIYPIERTPLNLILDKEFLLNKIKNLKQKDIDDKYINFIFFENENEINIFFDKKNFNLIGWQTTDIYQNLSITYLNSIKKNQKFKRNLFRLPSQN